MSTEPNQPGQTGPWGNPTQSNSPQMQGYDAPQAPGYDAPPAPAYGAPQAPYGAPMMQPAMTGASPAVADSGLVSIPNLGTVKVATLGQRLLARLIDGVVYVVVAFLLNLLAGALAAGGSAAEDGSGTATGLALGGLLLVSGLMWLFFVCYELVMVAVFGATVGKMLMGIKVVDMRNGQKPGFGASFIRIIIQAVGYLVCGIGLLVVWLSPLFDGSGRLQGWHDRAANDLVIGTR